MQWPSSLAPNPDDTYPHPTQFSVSITTSSSHCTLITISFLLHPMPAAEPQSQMSTLGYGVSRHCSTMHLISLLGSNQLLLAPNSRRHPISRNGSSEPKMGIRRQGVLVMSINVITTMAVRRQGRRFGRGLRLIVAFYSPPSGCSKSIPTQLHK